MGLLDRWRRESSPLNNGVATATSRTTPPPPPGSPAPRFAVIDLETTGLSPRAHRVLEVAVVTTDEWGRVLGEWSTRVNPQGPVGATHIHGIRAADVAHAPTFADLLPELTWRLAGAAVAAHHASFDLRFLAAEYARQGWEMPDVPTLCTMHASSYHLPTLDRRRLIDCCQAVGSPLRDAHSALGDARATASLLAAYMHPHYGLPPLPEHTRLPHQAVTVAWPNAATREPGLPTSTGGRALSARAATVMAKTAAAPPPATLISLMQGFSLTDAFDEGAPRGAVAYLKKLAEVLEDGVLTPAEVADLESVAEAESLTQVDVAAAHRAFVATLAHAALDDGKVTRAERAELNGLAQLLAVPERAVKSLLDHAEGARHERLSTGLIPLPPDWSLGEALRVGDKVVFTGCEGAGRQELEDRSEKLGVRVMGSISARTALLVADGTMDGTKAAKARDLGTRVVTPAQYDVLLRHLQPARVR